MSIPDYQTLMLPLLQWLDDGLPHTARQAYDHLSDQFKLSDDERSELLPSGNQPVIENRIGWAKTYLKKAGLIDSPKRGLWQISPRGKQLLMTQPTSLSNNDLVQFSEFQAFKLTSNLKTSESQLLEPNAVIDVKEQTPTESMDSSYQNIREALATELLSTIKGCSPAFFERLVVDLMLAMGYGGSRRDAGEATRLTADGGIDGVIREDRLGLDTIYLQAKRWEGTVGRPEIQKFAGALQGERARKGVFITTSNFSNEALHFVERLDARIILINGLKLSELMMVYKNNHFQQ
ncbi:restriction endonuclease [Jinshanibacter sp. LJY008]|uniref:Restriction endonuclease n=1 Tax=Limnobaculum eriocheiris TaxID=2897391 RepID=A0A9X1SKE1_9GAMM|nr:restriction endonuclease [Limnobaculum eriocheiris]MCD1125209.1 restriction endonuclease [Limnobaculum eriocheiris]